MKKELNNKRLKELLNKIKELEKDNEELKDEIIECNEEKEYMQE